MSLDQLIRQCECQTVNNDFELAYLVVAEQIVFGYGEPSYVIDARAFDDLLKVFMYGYLVRTWGDWFRGCPIEKIDCVVAKLFGTQLQCQVVGQIFAFKMRTIASGWIFLQKITQI